MNLDVEGHEMDIFKAFDLSVYKPSIISVEFLDLDMKYLEFKNNDLQRIVNSLAMNQVQLFYELLPLMLFQERAGLE
mgnify:CR=1 FL=1